MDSIKCKKHDCYWQCGDESKHNDCYFCSQNRNADEGSKGKKDNYIDVKDKFVELYDFLTGTKWPDGLTSKMPKLSSKRAFGVIYFLQEVTCCLPDYIEQCRGCLELYNSESEGQHLSDDYEVKGKTLAKKYWGNWCEDCIPEIDFEMK